MKRALRPLALGILLLAACASLWPLVVSGGAPDLAPRISVAPSVSDSLHLDVRVQWQASRAQRGATVDRYEGSVLVNGVIAGTFATAELSAVVTIDRPLPGDTAYIVASVVAVDSRGVRGEAGESAPLVYVEPLAGPTPPVVEIDTVAINDLSVLECGDTWCDLAWSHAAGVEAYAVFALATEPVALLDSLDVTAALAQLGGIVPDTAYWEVTSGLHLAGTLGMIVVHEGSCAWPVLASAGAMQCRIEGLRPVGRYRYVVRPAQLTE